MNQPNYKVGQTLFVVPSDGSAKIIVVKIVELISRETMSGNETSYKVSRITTVGLESKSVDLSSIKGELFTSIDELRDVIVKRSIAAIDDIVKRASDLVELPEQVVSSSKIIERSFDSREIDEDEFVVVELPDGTTARARVNT